MDHTPTANSLFAGEIDVCEDAEQDKTYESTIIEREQGLVINIQTSSQLSATTDYSANFKSGIDLA